MNHYSFSKTVSDFKIGWLGNVNVTSITMHKQYNNDTLENDIAILQIRDFPDLIPACLPVSHLEFVGHVGIPIGKQIFALGFYCKFFNNYCLKNFIQGYDEYYSRLKYYRYLNTNYLKVLAVLYYTLLYYTCSKQL